MGAGEIRADKLNPTDSLSPRDYRILTSEDDEQRLGLAIARADFALTDQLQLRTYWIPEFRPTTLIFPLSPQIARDNRTTDPGQFAVKIDSSGGAFDWSLSWYHGRDRIYDLTTTATGRARAIESGPTTKTWSCPPTRTSDESGTIRTAR